MQTQFRRLRPVPLLFVTVAFTLLLVSYWPVALHGTPSTSVVISEFRTRGPQGGNDEFIELYNLSVLPVNVGGWKIKASNSAGTIGTRLTITGGTILNPGCHFLATNSASGGYSGSVAGNQTYATGVTDDGGIAITLPDDTIVDQVGMSAGSAFKEGNPLSPQLTTNVDRSYERKPGDGNGSGTDTDNNPADFQLITPSAPQNLSSPCITSGSLTATGLATPTSVPAGNMVLLTVAVTPGTNPASSGISAVVNLSGVGDGSAQPLFDDGTHGDAFAGDNTFSFSYTIPANTAPGNKSLLATISDAQLRQTTATISLSVTPPPPPAVAIHDIQGSGTTSPFVGQLVTTTGIVTAVRFNNGFFMQTPDALADSDPNTSEGIFVFTSSAPPAIAAVGNMVSVTGTVAEFIPASDPSSPPSTEIASPTVTLISTANPLPAPIILTAADTSPTGTIEQLEKYEHMRVHVDSLTVIAPTDGTVNEANATSNSSGVFYGVITGVARPFREPGIQVPDPLPPGTPANVPRFDANPERLRVDADGQVGAVRTQVSPGAFITNLEVTSGALVSNLTGVLDFNSRTYTILPDPATPPTVTGNISAIPVPAPEAGELTVASFNTERFFDTTDDSGVSDVALTPTAFGNRLNKASLAIRNVMMAPDIIGVEEMENLATLQALANKVNSDTVAAGGVDPQYQAYLVEGNDVGGIDVGFLVKSTRVNALDVTQEGKDATYIDPTNGQPALLNDRPSLILRATVAQAGGDPLPITVIVNHLRSLSGVDDPADGARVRAKRRAQAEFLANLIQQRQIADPNENIVSVGDYNAFGFNDGYVDVMGTIEGKPTPADEVVLASPDLVNPNLTDLADNLPLDQQYSFSFDGNAQELDHVLLNAPMMTHFSRFAIARNDSDFPESYRSDPNRPERISDHDMAVAYFHLPPPDTTPPVLSLPGDVTVEATSPAGAVVSYVASAHDAHDGDVAIVCTPPPASTFALGPTTVNCSATDAHNNLASGSFKVTVVDTTLPSITLASPAHATYLVNQPVNADYSCSDSGSGLVGCSGTVANGSPIDTASAGAKIFTVTATDAVGNSRLQSVSYTVGYNACLLYDASRPAKSGSTIPIRIQLCDTNGSNVSSASTVVTAARLVYISSGVDGEVQDPGNANPDGNFRFDSNAYIFNLKTTGLAPGGYNLFFTASGDPTEHAIPFQVK
jgi:predicted extracellular nuclease